MPDINKSSIKLMASQVLADTEDGGGQMTSVEIVDGNVNNLFPDISRLDRTYGRVSMRKAYLSIQTDDRATYYGSHIALTEQASDPLVNTTLFTTKNWFDNRASCKSRIEGYLVKGPAYPSAVWGDHYSGTKTISLVVEKDWTEPKVGDVLVFRVTKNLSGAIIPEKEQFLRITDLKSEIKSFMENGNTFQKKELKITFGQAITFDVPGTSITNATTQGTGTVYTTTAADTSVYYGVTQLGVDAAKGALSIKAKQTTAPLVPSANSQTAITDFGAGMTRPIMLGSDNSTEKLTLSGGLNFTALAVTTLGFSIKPGTFTFGALIKDNGKGDLLDSATLEVVGAISYVNGTITMGTNSRTGNINNTFSFEPATKYDSPATSGAIIVELNNRGFVYVFNCDPSPKPGSLRVDFMSGGKWYSLFDVGGGELRGEEANIGTGTVNYITGSVSVTLAAMPDVSSMILFYWGVTLGAYSINSYNSGFAVFTEFNLADEAELGSLLIEWTIYDGATPVAMKIMDSGDGTLQAYKNDALIDANCGEYDPVWRRAIVTHAKYTPASMQEYEVSYEVNAPVAQRQSSSINGSGTATITYALALTENIKPGSIRMAMQVTMIDPAIGTEVSITEQNTSSWSTTTKKTAKSNLDSTVGQGWYTTRGNSWDGWVDTYGVTMVGSNVKKNTASTSDKSGAIAVKTTTVDKLDLEGARTGTVNVYDNGLGDLLYNGEVIGEINYSTGLFTVDQRFTIPALVKVSQTKNSSKDEKSSDSGSNTSGGDSGTTGSAGSFGTAHWTNTWKKDEEISAADGTTYAATGAIEKKTVEMVEVLLQYGCTIANSIAITWLGVGASGTTKAEVHTKALEIEFPVAFGYHIQAGSLWLTDSAGNVLKDDAMGAVRLLGFNYLSEEIGTIDYSTGIMTVTKHLENSTKAIGFSITDAVITKSLNEGSYWTFRCPGSPITPGSFTLQVTANSGEVISATAGFDGQLQGDKVDGYINFSNGIVEVMFGKFYNWTAVQNELWAQAAPRIEDPVGTFKVFKHELIQPSTLTMNCVVETYLPLDATLLGLDPVRLPLDGKVPIFRDGNIILIHNTTTELVIPAAGSIAVLSRKPVNLIEVYDNNGVYVPEVGNYSVDLINGEIAWEDPLNLSAYTGPFQALHRIEDMVLAIDVQITGYMGISQPLTHDYPKDTTLVSSVLPIGDLQARIYNMFTDSSWGSVWQDTRKYSPTTAQYDQIHYPIITTNKGSIKERFACIFTAATTVNVVGESLGVLLSNAPITADIAPLNPATGLPYFTILKEGWGAGWATGQVLRFNSDAGNYPIWFCRTTRQGPATENSDHYTIQIRGDSS